MDDLLVVEVDEPLDEVVEVVLQFSFCDSFAALDHFVESVVAADLQNYVYVLAVLEDVIEKQDIFVLQTFVDFYFGHQLR